MPTTNTKLTSATGRDYAREERVGFDIHLNDRAHWISIPAAVWNYKLGGYQVLKNGSPTASAKSCAAP